MNEATDVTRRRHREDELRVMLSGSNPVPGQLPYSQDEADAMIRAITSSQPVREQRRPRRTRRRRIVIGCSVAGAVAFGGVSAVAGFRPVGEVASAPLAAPIILNGVGPAAVPLPPVPRGATYLSVELTCFDGTLCATPGGSVGHDGPSSRGPLVQRDILPTTSAFDPKSAQNLPPLDPARGLPVTVNAGTHWRLYAVYTDSLTPRSAPLKDRRTAGIPGIAVPPDLVPAVASNGRTGWVDYRQLTSEAHPQLTERGVSQPPIPVYDDDGSTVIGTADVSRTVL